ncbi:DNA-directed RNA polymerase subunit H [Candidatus Woesearchaeota archaeon]|nr:DNA-directed RNA polymerase subunit H [Candidatus Woesearchaeota archaeon]
MAKKIDITKHLLVPKHVLVSDSEKKKVTDTLKLSGKELPRMLKTDPSLADLKVKDGDVIKIIRDSKTAGKTVFYRRIISS